MNGPFDFIKSIRLLIGSTDVSGVSALDPSRNPDAKNYRRFPHSSVGWWFIPSIVIVLFLVLKACSWL